MKVEWRTILGASVFLGATGLVYWALITNPTEAAGVAMLIFGFAAYGMLFFYLWSQYLKRHRLPRPEDRFDATYTDGEGEVGYFPSASIWPAGMGLGLIFGVLGLTFGNWYLVPAGHPVLRGRDRVDRRVRIRGGSARHRGRGRAAAAAGHPGHLDPHPERYD